MPLRLVIAGLVITTMVAPPAYAADAKAGRDLVKRQCQVCHGIDGIAKIPIAPHLAGENDIYIQTQLKAFRSGKRQHEMMTVVAEGLTDDDIANAAAWFASIRISVTMPECGRLRRQLHAEPRQRFPVARERL